MTYEPTLLYLQANMDNPARLKRGLTHKPDPVLNYGPTFRVKGVKTETYVINPHMSVMFLTISEDWGTESHAIDLVLAGVRCLTLFNREGVLKVSIIGDAPSTTYTLLEANPSREKDISRLPLEIRRPLCDFLDVIEANRETPTPQRLAMMKYLEVSKS